MMTELLKLLPQIMRKAGDSDEAREQAVFAAWTAVVGSPLRKVTAPVKLERKTLLVAVPDSTWRDQLKSFRGHALFKLNSLLGSPAVTAIEFVINPRFVSQARQAPREIRFIDAESQALPLRDHAGRIPNPEVRAVFLRAAGKCLERRAR